MENDEALFELETALARLPLRHLVNFIGKEAVQVFDLEDTGERQTLVFGMEEEDVEVLIPVNHWVPNKPISLGQFIEGFIYRDPDEPEEYRIIREVQNVEYLEWKKHVPGPSQYKKAASEILAERGEDELKTSIVCEECENRPHLHLGHQCAVCLGDGYIPKYPHVKLLNEESGDSIEITIDLAALVASGELEAKLVAEEMTFHNGWEQATLFVVFQVANYVGSKLDLIGIKDTESKVMSAHGLIDASFFMRNERTYANYYWEQKGEGIKSGIRQQGLDAKKPTLTVKEIIELAQERIGREWTFPLTDTLNERGIPERGTLRYRPIRTFSRSFRDMLEAAEAKGYHLGYFEKTVGTGDSRSVFCLTDAKGAILRELSLDYGVRNALENAWLTLCET